ncbi:TetR/AcrR family transcriptional regulator [Micromonospora sp. NPDC050686]|uniref:TetR/AcrR family transcriptional regulator n=1 Tax=Micromonospora sp. NPDC050686 TaxID=3154631 RepID=UPI0033E8310C
MTLAIELADDVGLENVSMRLLADRAGLPAHLLYRHVRNRGDLLGMMAEQVIDARRARTAASRDDPRTQLAHLARDEWAMYRRHPWLLTVLASDRPPTGPAVLAMVDHVVSVLADAGFGPAEAYRAYLVLSGYIQGMALLIPRQPADTDYRSWRAATRLRLERTGRLRQRPWLTAATQTDPDEDLDTWFEFGLDRLLDGLLADGQASRGTADGTLPERRTGPHGRPR